MKFKIVILLFLFVGVLITPIIVFIFDNTVDTSYIFSLAEEENKDQTESISFDEVTLLAPDTVVNFSFFSKKKYPVKNLELLFNNKYSSTISPPPEFL